jgi:uncharacterized LabA/DUF88 family protein
VTLYVYVDNSNLWIEGMRISAVRRGLATSIDDALEHDITDHGWTYDFGKLYQAVCPIGQAIGRSSLFGSRPPANDSLWQLARNNGFEVSVFDRNYANKEKQVDVAIATQMTADSYEHMSPGDKAVLVSGDRDYLPTIEHLHNRGFPTVVAFWEHATGRELKAPPADFFALDGLFDYLTR